MNVTFAFPAPSLNGGCRVVAIYAQLLVNAGHRVTIVCPSHKHGGIANVIKRLLSGGLTAKKRLQQSHFGDLQDVSIKFLPPNSLDNPHRYPDADVLVATWWKTAEWVAHFPPSKGQKLYFVQHYEAHEEQPLKRVEKTYRSGIPKIVIAEWIAEVMQREYGDDTTILVPNAVNRSDFYRDCEVGQTNRNTFCAMYSQSNFKGVDITLSAFQRLRERCKEAKLVLFGAKPVSGQISLPKGVEFELAPSLQRLRKIYSTSRAFIFSSRSEGFGLPVLEALACGCPVVATEAGCAPSYIENGVNGFLNKIDDVIGQSDSLIKVMSLSDPEWQKMSSAALETVADSSWENSYMQFERALQAISVQGQQKSVALAHE